MRSRDYKLAKYSLRRKQRRFYWKCKNY